MREFSWLAIPDRVTFFRMSHLFRIRHNLAPKYLLPNFTALSQVHGHNTRGSLYNFQLTRDLSKSPSSFAFTSIKQWNGLPSHIKSITDFKVFKRKLREFFISQYDWFYDKLLRISAHRNWNWIFFTEQFLHWFSLATFLWCYFHGDSFGKKLY